MAKRELKKTEIITTRISILFFHTLALCGLLWAENFARYRYDYIFRNMLPWLLPILAAAGMALLAYLTVCYFRKGRAAEKKVLSPSFGIYLALPLPALFFFPWLTHFGEGLQLFKLALSLVFYGLVGYFIAFILYHNIKPAAALLTFSITGNALLLTYFYKMYLAPSRYILLGAEYGYLTPWGMAALLAGILIALTVLCVLLAGNGALRLPKSAVLLPAGLTLLLLILPLALDSLLSGVLMRSLIFGGIGLQGLWLAMVCVWLKIKKK